VVRLGRTRRGSIAAGLERRCGSGLICCASALGRVPSCLHSVFSLVTQRGLARIKAHVRVLELPLVALHLELFGAARLNGGEPLERKTAALLAFLSLEGTTSRSKLAGLLWPDSLESTARNNLAQALRRLKRNHDGLELVVGSDALTLQHLQADAVNLELAFFAADHVQVIEARGVLLGAYEFDDCPEFDDWLLAQREHLVDLRRKSLVALAEREQLLGHYREALGFAEAVLETDPVSEVAHRRVMQLWYLLGDRSAALRAFERCTQVLEHELGVVPLPETLALAEQIAQGDVGPGVAASRSEIPLAVLRPPQLIGREQVWAQMELAWENGQAIFLSGPPGVGKSRLIQDFLASKQTTASFEGRPGDSSIPYTTAGRLFRQLLLGFPNLILPDWVRHELTRIIPELGVAPAAIQSEADKLRFFQAQAEASRLAFEQGLRVLAIDDLQFMDSASLEASHFVLSQHWGRSDGLRTLLGFRTAELSAQTETLLGQVVQSGAAVRIDLEPLNAAAIEALLQSMALPETHDLALALGQHTGGNPLFLLETVRSLWESNELGSHQRLPLPKKVGALIQGRLERLSAPALRLAFTAAVADLDFSLELAAQILGSQHPLDLVETLAELEAAQVILNQRFVHDLLYEATLQAVPAAIKIYLHRQTASFLELQQADPACIAGHWRSADQPGKAAPWWQRAAQVALEQYRLTEAAEFLEHAGRAWLSVDVDQAMVALLAAVQQRLSFDMFEGTQKLIDLMFQASSTPSQQVKAWLAKAIVLNARLLPTEAEPAARAGLDLAVTELAPQLRSVLAESLWRQKRHREAIPEMIAAIQAHKADGDTLTLAQLEGRLGIYYGDSENHSAAREHLERSVDLLEEIGDEFATLKSRNMLGLTLGRVGRAREAMLQHELVRDGCERIQGADQLAQMNRANMGQRLFELDRYAQALETVRQCQAKLHSKLGWPRAFLLIHEVRIKLRCAALDGLEALETEILAIPEVNDELRFDLGLLRIQRLQRQAGLEAARGASDQVRAVVGAHSRPFNLIDFKLIEAGLLPPEESLVLATEALRLCERHDLNGLKLAALMRSAQALQALGQLEPARQQITLAAQGLESMDCNSFYRAEIWWTQIQILEQLESPAVPELLQRLNAWIRDLADQDVPGEYRQAFLEQHPVNRAVLEASDRLSQH
jgi:DNA-binding SARP family transcriptional activator